MAEKPEKPEDDDEVESSRAPLLEHLIELRKRLIIAAVAMVVAFAGCFFLAEPVFTLLVEPYLKAKDMYEATGGQLQADLVFTGPLEFFLVKVKLALLGAVAIAFPVVAWQLYAFVAPGLYKKERGALLPFLFAMPILFLAGCAVVYYLVLPLVMNFSLRQQYSNARFSIDLLLRVEDYFKLATALLLAFGAAFQLPIVLTLLGKAGIVTARGLRKAWKYAVVGIFVVAAFMTPPDLISQTILAVPILMLYELSIWCVKLVEKKRAEEDAEYEAKLKAEDEAEARKKKQKAADKAAAKAVKKNDGGKDAGDADGDDKKDGE